MNVPETVKKQLEDLLALRQRQYAAKKELDAVRSCEMAEFRKMCEARLVETSIYSREILKWIWEFRNTPEVLEILNLPGVITIFKAGFFQHRPMPAYVAVTYTTIELRLDSLTRWTLIDSVEWHDGERIRESTLGQNRDLGRALAFSLHPDFLKQWYEEIQSGKIWEFIESSLK